MNRRRGLSSAVPRCRYVTAQTARGPMLLPRRVSRKGAKARRTQREFKIYMNRINNRQIESIIILFFLFSLIIISFFIDNRTISWIDNDGELHFSDEFMSGGEDFVALGIAFFLFLPVSILYVIDIFKRIKVILLILIMTILVQLYFIYIWFESSDIFLNLLYGTIKIQLWIITFGIIILYAVIKIIIGVTKNIMDSQNLP